MLRKRIATSFRFSSFVLKASSFLPDYKVELREYEHSGTQAKLVHFDCADEHKAFASAFRSRVSNSHGAPHVLEHIMCCGSEAYPVRDPFMALTKRSLNSYMNAWTGPDFIAFPFATINNQDFNNLLDVYLNMVFKPLLKEQDFRQEGWRLDLHEEPEIKGVVFNEMKGHYQSADNVFHQYIQEYVLNGTEYAHSYGGDPQHIPNLSHSELINYYRNTFDPNGALFYMYGNIDFKSVSAKIDQYLNGKVDKLNRFGVQGIIPREPPKVLPLPPSLIDEGSQQAHLSFTYRLPKSLISDPITSLAYGVISHILFEQFSGLLYKSLIDTGLVGSFGKMAGAESYGVYSLYNLAFQGVQNNRETVQQIFDIVQKELQNLVVNGIPNDMIEGYLHQVEIQTKAPNSDQGIKLFEQGLNSLIHSQNLASQYNISSTVKDLKERISQGYLQQLITESLLKNANVSTLFARPDPIFLKNMQKQEQTQVNELVNSLTPEEEEQIQELNSLLEEEQNQEQDLSVLPTLTVRDIARTAPAVSYETQEHEKIKIHFVKENTNGMTFFRLVFRLGNVTRGLRQYLQMFCTFITRVGTQRLRSDDLSKELNLCSTGLDASFESYQDLQNPDLVRTHLTISIACLDAKIEQALTLLQEILSSPVFSDQENIQSVLRNHSTNLQSELLENSLSYAQSQANQFIRENAFNKDINFSVQSLQASKSKFFMNFATKFEKAPAPERSHYLDDFTFQMTSMMNHLMKQHRLEVIVHTGNQERSKLGIQRLIDGLAARYEGFTVPQHDNFIDEQYRFKPSYPQQLTLIPSQVNFVVSARPIPQFAHIDTAPLVVMGSILSNSYLHREIREKGGAYGAGCSLLTRRGLLNLWSYRDPNILKTIERYNNIELGIVSDRELQEAKLTVFQKIDRPQDPQSKGIDEIVNGIQFFRSQGATQQLQDEFRARLLDTTANDVQRVFAEYLATKQVLSVFCNPEHEDIPTLKGQGWKVENFLD